MNENRVTTSDRLKYLMSERNIRQVDIVNLCKPFAEKYRVKIGRNDISQYVSGKVEPGQSKIFILAKALGVNEAWLMGYDVNSNTDDAEKDLSKYGIYPIKTKKFRVIGEIACGEPIFCNEEYETYVEGNADIDADFCLKAKGDSMINARIFNGDIVFIKSMPEVENGEIAAVVIDNEATLKRVYYYKDENKIVLVAENAKYEPLVYIGEELNQIRIIGKAIAFQSYVE